jgi:tetratricopeptide (TPR) repeat protein
MSKQRAARLTGTSPKSGLGSARQQKLLGEALTLLRAGQLQQAGELCDAVLGFDPHQTDALHMGGVIALQRGRFDTAVERLGRLVTQQPGNAPALSDYALALQQVGRLAEAEAALTDALRQRRNFPEAWVNLGNVLAAAGRDSEAADCYAEALQQRPAFPEAHNNLALAQLRLGLPATALLGAQRALTLRPGMIEAQQTMAGALDALGRPDDAIAVCRDIIDRHPRFAAAWYDLGTIELHYGRLDAAAAHIRQALALAPGRGEWHRMLANIVRHAADDPEIAAMQRLDAQPATSEEERLHLAFGLGKALEDTGAHDLAFDHFLAGNRMKRQRLTYASADSDALFADIKAAFTPERLARHAGSGTPDATPIFVLGMPRSGTSLVEQVIASHPEVRGGGEFTLLNRLVGSLGDGRSGPFRFGDLLDHIEDTRLRAVGEDYVREIRALSATAGRITDKTPGNFLLIGMIRLLLPNAKIIHCRRDPVDTCLSIFKTYFGADGLRYAYDLGEIGHYYALYADLMAHWDQVLPGVVHAISYEALVADFDAEAPKLLAACGLDWREECRSFFNTARSVQTASSAQVRRPIYSSSIGLAARYGDRIGPLLAALGHPSP